MDNDLTSQSILSGILAGNETLERWTGGDWVGDRGGVEYFLISSVGDHFLKDMPGWLIWPETKTGDDFKHVHGKYHDHVDDCRPVDVFGGVRYDLGLLRSSCTISGLIEIKRYWTPKHLEEKGDLTKLARTLFYLGKKPQRVQGGAKEGVLLESVFFGAFIWHDPTASKDDAPPVKEQADDIQTKINTWWQGAKTGGGLLIQERFRTGYDRCPQPKILWRSKSGAGKRGHWEAGAVCVCLSLDEDP